MGGKKFGERGRGELGLLLVLWMDGDWDREKGVSCVEVDVDVEVDLGCDEEDLDSSVGVLLA